MISGVKLLLLQICMTALLALSDTWVGGLSKASPRCQRMVADECGQPPTDGAKNYRCYIQKRNCRLSCKYSCKKGPNGELMELMNKRYAKDVFICKNGEWVPRDIGTGYCLAKSSVKEVKQNLCQNEAMNDLANNLFQSSFEYLAMSLFYERADVALFGFSKLMKKLWETEVKHAQQLNSYILTRGGYSNLAAIPRPTSHEDLLLKLGDRTGLQGLKKAMAETRSTNNHVIDLIKRTASNRNCDDPHTKHYLEDGILDHKVETLKKLGDLENQLQSFVPQEDYFIGEYTMDLELHE